MQRTAGGQEVQPAVRKGGRMGGGRGWDVEALRLGRLGVVLSLHTQ